MSVFLEVYAGILTDETVSFADTINVDRYLHVTDRNTYANILGLEFHPVWGLYCVVLRCELRAPDMRLNKWCKCTQAQM